MGVHQHAISQRPSLQIGEMTRTGGVTFSCRKPGTLMCQLVSFSLECLSDYQFITANSCNNAFVEYKKNTHINKTK